MKDYKIINEIDYCIKNMNEEDLNNIMTSSPEDIENFPKILTNIMEASAAKYCKSLPIPAEASVGTHWIH